MKDIIKKTFLLGLGAASLTKIQAEKIVRGLVKKNGLTVKDGKEMLRKMAKVAKKEGKKARMLAGQEARKAAGKLGLVYKSQLKYFKKRLQSIDMELSSRGKKTLDKIIKELSK